MPTFLSIWPFFSEHMSYILQVPHILLELENWLSRESWMTLYRLSRTETSCIFSLLYMNYTTWVIMGKLELYLDCFQVNFGHSVAITAAIKSFLSVAIILIQVANDNWLKCKSCVIICNEGEKINLLCTTMKFDSFQVQCLRADWLTQPCLLKRAGMKISTWCCVGATSCQPCHQETLNIPVPGVDKFITVTSQGDLCWHDLDRSLSERQMVIKDNDVTAFSLA